MGLNQIIWPFNQILKQNGKKIGFFNGWEILYEYSINQRKVVCIYNTLLSGETQI